MFQHPSAPESKAAAAYPQVTSQLAGPSNWVREYWEHPERILADLGNGSKRIHSDLIAASGTQIVSEIEPPSLGDVMVLGIGSLLSRRAIPLRSPASGGGGTGSAPSAHGASHGSKTFGTKEHWEAQGRSDLLTLFEQIEQKTASWASIRVPRISEDGTRLEVEYLHFLRESLVERRGALAEFLRIVRQLGMSVKIDRMGG